MSVKIDPQSSSEYLDVDTGVSKAELLLSEGYQDAEMQRDYWFGKKYLECIAAQDLLQRISLHETVAGTDVRKVVDVIRSSNGDVEARNRHAALPFPSAFGGTTSSRNLNLWSWGLER
ncbi:hypothetical protein LTR66_004261 [Elasticomyces elasticus]|nr:hypothetical protein LTR66_004261 [Elasticomyces elasticus]